MRRAALTAPKAVSTSKYLVPTKDMRVSLCGEGTCFWYLVRTPQAILLQSREFDDYQKMRREVAAVLLELQRNDFLVEDVDDGSSTLKSLVISVMHNKSSGRWMVASHHGPVASIPGEEAPAKNGNSIVFYPDRVIVDGQRYLVETINRSGSSGLDVYVVIKELKHA